MRGVLNLTRLAPRRAMTVGALAVVVAGASGCGGSDGDATVDPASALPAGAPLYFELTVRPEGDLRADVEAVARKVLRTSDPGAAIIKVVNSVIGDASDKDPTTFEKDIDPWLGDKLGVAITSLRRLDAPDFAVALASKDNDKAMESLDDEDATEAEYKDVKYLRKKGENSVAGTVGDTLVIGTENGFKAAVDATKGDQQLDDTKGLADARKRVDLDEALGFVYLDLAKALTAVAASQPLIASQIGPLKDLLGDATSIGMTIGVADDAIRLEAVQIGGPAAKSSGDPAASLAALPSSTIVGAGLGEVGKTLQQVVDQVAKIGPVAGQDPQQLLRGLEAQLGISIQRDLLSWMGEGAIFAEGTSLSNLGGGIVVRSTAPETTKATLTKIAPVLQRFGVPVVDRAPEGAETGFRISTGGSGAPDVLVGLKSDRFVVGVNPTLVRRVLEGRDGDRLADDQGFTSAASKLGDGIRPSFYLDVQAVLGLVEQAVGGEPGFRKAKPYLETFTALVAGAKRDGDVNRSRLVLGVK